MDHPTRSNAGTLDLLKKLGNCSSGLNCLKFGSPLKVENFIVGRNMTKGFCCSAGMSKLVVFGLLMSWDLKLILIVAQIPWGNG